MQQSLIPKFNMSISRPRTKGSTSINRFLGIASEFPLSLYRYEITQLQVSGIVNV
jgi:hypothetical protein